MATERLRALVGLDYPKPEHYDAVVEAGGRSKLTDEEREKYYKRVEAGEWCDDFPEGLTLIMIEQGKIEIAADRSDEDLIIIVEEEKDNG